MNIIIASVPIFVFLILIEIGVNIFKKASYYRVNDAINNVSAGIIQQVLGFAPAFLEVILYLFILENFSIARGFFGQTDWWMWILLFIIVDFQYYWFHRLSHRVNILWTGHVVHHQSEEYNLTVALRQSILQRLYSIPFNLPFAFLGVDMYLLIAVVALNTVAQFWIHTRFIKRLPAPVEAILNTPSHHRVHHGRNPQYIDKNYAGAFIIWDRMFGTFEPEDEEVVYGITVPTTSWNPINAQLSTLQDLMQKIKQTPRWKDKFLYLLMPPGWTPETEEQPVVLEQRAKYDPPLTLQQTILAVAMFLITLILGLVFLTKYQDLAFWSAAGLLLSVLAALTGIGIMMDRGKAQVPGKEVEEAGFDRRVQ